MKRLLIILLVLALPMTASGQVVLGRTWTCSLAGLVATLTECQAVPTDATDYYVITEMVIQSTTGTAGDYAIQTGTGVNCVTGTAALFPSVSTSARFKAPIAANPPAVIVFNRTPLAAPAGAAICVIGHGTNTINIQLNGFINH
jgi:hypothetical protein